MELTVQLAALASVKVDREKKIIFGASICTIGPAIGHNCECDKQTLSQIKALCDAMPDGLPVRDTVAHEGAKIGDTIGTIKNARFDGDKLRGDIHILDTHPAADHYLALADKMPASFGLSINGKGHDTKANGKTVKRITALSSVDLVEKPAANPNGLFSQPAVTLTGSQPMSDQATKIADASAKTKAAFLASAKTKAAFLASANAAKNHSAEAHEAATVAHRDAAMAQSTAGHWQASCIHSDQAALHAKIANVLNGGQLSAGPTGPEGVATLSQPPAAAAQPQTQQETTMPEPTVTPAPAAAPAPAPAPAVTPTPAPDLTARLSALEETVSKLSKPEAMEGIITRAFAALFSQIGVDPAKFSAAPVVTPAPAPAVAAPAEKTFGELVASKMEVDKCSKSDAIKFCVKNHPVAFAAAKAAGNVIL